MPRLLRDCAQEASAIHMQRCDHWRLQRVVYSHACYTHVKGSRIWLTRSTGLNHVTRKRSQVSVDSSASHTGNSRLRLTRSPSHDRHLHMMDARWLVVFLRTEELDSARRFHRSKKMRQSPRASLRMQGKASAPHCAQIAQRTSRTAPCRAHLARHNAVQSAHHVALKGYQARVGCMPPKRVTKHAITRHNTSVTRL